MASETQTQQSQSVPDIKEIKTIDVIKYFPPKPVSGHPERYLVKDVDNKFNTIYVNIISIPEFPELKTDYRYVIPISRIGRFGPEIRKEEFEVAFEGQGLLDLGPSPDAKPKTIVTKQRSLEESIPAEQEQSESETIPNKPQEVEIIDRSITPVEPVSEFVPQEPNKYMILSDYGLPAKDLVQAHFDHYNFIKELMISNNHYVMIDGNPYLKKEGWFSLGEGFGISRDEHDIMEERVWTDDAGEIHVYYRVRVVMPNGRAAVDVGVCSTSEKGRSKMRMHEIYATALTRATVRAISFLIGKGSVSAEEIR